MIAILDYDAGNIKSVEKAVHYLGEEAVITRDKDLILSCDKVILPGVGSFGDAMGKLREYKLDQVIYDFLESALAYSFCIRQARKAREQRDLEFWTARFYGFQMHRI